MYIYIYIYALYVCTYTYMYRHIPGSYQEGLRRMLRVFRDSHILWRCSRHSHRRELAGLAWSAGSIVKFGQHNIQKNNVFRK